MKIGSPIPKKHARIEIIPLIDIMFFLLASFMMVSLSQTHMKGIRVNLPAPGGVPPNTKKDYIAIRVMPGPVYYIDNQAVNDIGDVKARLFQQHSMYPDIKVSISADLMSMHGDVIAALDAVRDVGIQKVGYQIRAAQGAPH